MRKTTFALFFGDRALFPKTMIAEAVAELTGTLDKAGYAHIMPEPGLVPNFAVESPAEGRRYAEFLKTNRGQYDGVILCLPNFGDENGAIAALRDADVPILIQGYPDELDKMGSESRRDAYCGKFSIMDVFTQFRVPFTVLKPHVTRPGADAFARNLAVFAGVCRVVKGMRRTRIGAIGARTTAFKTVRFDELTLEKYGVTTEAFDLSEVFARIRDIGRSDEKFVAKANGFRRYADWGAAPDAALENVAKLAVVLDDIVAEAGLDAIALRCWLEIEKELKISPCVTLSALNDAGLPAACELDVCNAVAMRALSLATGGPAACLDWNNNYGDDPDKCVLFHCGPVPQKMMAARGEIVDHPMFARVLGAGNGFGCNQGRIAASPFTFASSVTQDGKLIFYLGEGEFTKDPLPKEFFGCGGVAKIPDLQNKLIKIGRGGYRHHVSVSFGLAAEALREAFASYLNYEVMAL